MTDTVLLDRGWSFRRIHPELTPLAWSQVDLPHCPFVADLNGQGHWLGQCEYRRPLRITKLVPGVRYVLAFGAAMHTAQVLIDDQEVGHHVGGYLPFEVEITPHLREGTSHFLTVRLDNRSNGDVPPGKRFEDLDFCWYGGLYRSVELRMYPEIHITDPVAADEPAGGGIFVRTLSASAEKAVLQIKVHVRNTGRSPRDFQVEVDLLRGAVEVSGGNRVVCVLPGRSSTHVEIQLSVEQPHLWSPANPALHQVRVSLRSPDGNLIDTRSERVGIRRIGFSRSGGFVLNGQPLRLRGTNRHQEYPYAGYALPRLAQVRDARRIKEAGFDYVRLSHYPQSPDFLNACDELGIVVLNCIPGWQFLGGERFRENCFEAARHLIRRDRNHACVIAWELSLNETQMDEAFMKKLRAIGHEEYPGDQMFTAGWLDRYDIYLHSRQHGEIHRWKNDDKAMIVAEYGDWEFYASNEGFDQKTGAGVHAAWSNSRQFRGDGERGLRQQVWNHVIALNDTLSSPAVLDGQWAMFDYARGYHPLRAACGVMDVFRLPKFSYHFYRSQRGPAEKGEGWTGGPMVFIASHWTPASDLRILVFSNCDQVELRLNQTVVARQKPAITWMTQFLPHAPFVFDLPHYTAGTLEAVAYLGDQVVARHSVSAPGLPSQLELVVDTGGVPIDASGPDLVFAHVQVRDAQGNLCIADQSVIAFAVLGQAEILGPQTVQAEAGIASILLRLPTGSAQFALRAQRAVGNQIFSAACHWKQGQFVPSTEGMRPLQTV